MRRDGSPGRLEERAARPALLGLCLAWLVAAPALGAGVKIYVDYDGATSFGQLRTFQYRNTWHDLRAVSPELHELAVRHVIGFARAGGLALVPESPDLYMAYYVASEGDLTLAAGGLPYAYGASFRPGPHWRGEAGTRDPESGAFTFERGTVVVDVWHRQRGELVWRGIATGALEKGHQWNGARWSRVLVKLMKRWDEIYGDPAEAIRKLEAGRQR